MVHNPGGDDCILGGGFPPKNVPKKNPHLSGAFQGSNGVRKLMTFGLKGLFSGANC